MSRGHHLLFEKNLWNAHDPNRKLRMKPGLIMPIDRDTHDELHKEIAGVVSPPHRLGESILALYDDCPDNHLQSMENVMRATQEAINHSRVRPVERMIGELIIASVEAQQPFIKEGLCTRLSTAS